VIVDTSALLAFFDADEADHLSVNELLLTTSERLVVSPYVVAELDYLVQTRLGVSAELAVIRELGSGAWELPGLGSGDMQAMADVIETYHDQRIGAADASNVVLARQFQTKQIATLDHRHFSVLRPLTGGHFTIVP
jgi:predicted nucleic acid-binding protein